MSSYYFAPGRFEHPLEIISFKPLITDAEAEAHRTAAGRGT